MGSKGFRFWIAPGIKNDNIITATTTTVRRDDMIAVIEVRPPLQGEQGWQCFADSPLQDQIREMLADWGGDAPGWTAWEANAKGDADGEHGAFHVTILAAFDWGRGERVRMSTQAELMQVQGFRCDCSQLPCICEHMKAGRTLTSEAWRVGRTKSVQDFLAPVIAAMGPLEEIGGPEDADYLVVMESIANEARRRAESLKRQLGPAHTDGCEQRPLPDGGTVGSCTCGGTADGPDDNASTTFTIELEIGGDPAAAREAVDAALDAGALQDAINEYESDDGEVEVTSAVLK